MGVLYPQDGEKSQLASKLRHCHPMYLFSEFEIGFARAIVNMTA